MKDYNEYRQFLYISKGSCGELRSMIILSKELNIISEDDFNKMYIDSKEISKIISGLIKKL